MKLIVGLECLRLIRFELKFYNTLNKSIKISAKFLISDIFLHQVFLCNTNKNFDLAKSLQIYDCLVIKQKSFLLTFNWLMILFYQS